MPLRNATEAVVLQAQQLITLCQRVYTKPCELAMSPIGTHVRHIIDHLWAFQDGHKTACIDYNTRRRDTALERDPALADRAITQFLAWFNDANLDNRGLTVISEISIHQCESTLMKSTINRELAYLINHSLHHVAYAKLIAKAHGIAVPEQLGIAPATATYLRKQQAKQCAP